MSEETEPEPVKTPIATRIGRAVPGLTGWGDARARVKDLCIVFFGVYAAFALNRYETDRRDTQRRAQILESLEREVSANVDEMKQGLVAGQAEVDRFDRRLAAGEMPNLGIAYSNSSYSPSDDATFLQAGGIEVLDVQTLDELRKVNGLRRSFAASMQNQFQLELMILGPQEGGGFYDPETKQLKKHFTWYPVVLHHIIADAQALLAGEEEFLRLIRTKRQAR